MADPRLDDPNLIAMSNGPIRTVTAPVAPKFALDADGQEIEYLVPFPMHVRVDALWPWLEFDWNGIPVRVQQPIAAIANYSPEGAVGNEAADAFCTMIRVRTPPGAKFDTDAGWLVVETLLQWIRVKCRHYWLLHGVTGFGALYRSSVLFRTGKTVSLRNVATYRPGLIVRPLTREIWVTCNDELETRAELPLADSLYCDALLSTAAGDEMKALVEAGVAAEVAITQLLLECSKTLPDTAAKARFRKKKGDFRPFKVKLNDVPQELGMNAATTFSISGMPNDWLTRLEELYQLRNGVVHAGKLKSATSTSDVISGLFAVNTLLEYCRLQREKLGLKNFTMPPGTTVFSQTVAYSDAHLRAESGPSEIRLP